MTLAERAGLDLVTIEDALTVQSSRRGGFDDRSDQVRGRLDAVQIAARVAPVTSRIGLVPTTVITLTEPFHLASAISTLDHISDGRAGWRPRVSGFADEAAHVNVRAVAQPVDVDDLFHEADDVVEVVRRLWDSWEDDAIIKDVATGRFVDRDRLHYIDFEGTHFSVKGPSIVPRPPQGQPLVTALAHSTVPYWFAARSADVVYVTPREVDDTWALVREVRDAERVVGRVGDPLVVLVDLVVHLRPDAAASKARLDELDGRELRSDAAIFTGTAAELADLVIALRARGAQGVRLRPLVATDDLPAIADDLLPLLRTRNVVDEPATGTLRERFGLGRPASRYEAAAS